jgi:GT2 family glycosyltransferase
VDIRPARKETLNLIDSQALPSSAPKVLVVRLCAVIVLYKLQASESPSLQTLLAAVAEVSSSEIQLQILIQDNTPGGQNIGAIPSTIRYETAPENPGLANAYNRALEFAQANNCEWLLTLDQDTTLPRDYLVHMVKRVKQLDSDARIGAIVPQVVDKGRNLSPFRFAAGFMPRWFAFGFVGVSVRATYALNSAAVLRVSSLAEIGGYDYRFPLDISDINLFHRLHADGKRVFVAGDILVGHSFSLLNKDKRMSMDRYRKMLGDECAFWDLYMGPLARLERFVRLVGRVGKDYLFTDDRAFCRATLLELKRRLMTRRRQRIAEWMKRVEKRR